MAIHAYCAKNELTTDDWRQSSTFKHITLSYSKCNDISILSNDATMSGWADERWGGERICNPSTLSWWTSANYDISRLSKEFFALWLGGEFSRCRRHSVKPSYHPATNLMFSGQNPPDREPKTPQRFFAQNPIFRCVKNFMHLISFYLSLIISIYL